MPKSIEVDVLVVDSDVLLLAIQRGKTYRPGLAIAFDGCTHRHRSVQAAADCAIAIITREEA